MSDDYHYDGWPRYSPKREAELRELAKTSAGRANVQGLLESFEASVALFEQKLKGTGWDTTVARDNVADWQHNIRVLRAVLDEVAVPP